MNARVHSVVESIDAPAVAERRAAALASAKNSDAAPTPESAPEAAIRLPETPAQPIMTPCASPSRAAAMMCP